MHLQLQDEVQTLAGSWSLVWSKMRSWERNGREAPVSTFLQANRVGSAGEDTTDRGKS